jgi:hypothetical protein
MSVAPISSERTTNRSLLNPKLRSRRSWIFQKCERRMFINSFAPRQQLREHFDKLDVQSKASMKTTDLPIKIRIASPCTARWEDMGGDDRIRFCDHCQKNVYNLSAMTTAEARVLLADGRERLCARVFQRLDGTVLTEDCPVGVARQWRRVKTLVIGGLAAIALAVVNVLALQCDREDRATRNRLVDQLVTMRWQLKQLLGLNPPQSSAVLGMVSPITTAPTPPTTSPPPAPSPQPTAAQDKN